MHIVDRRLNSGNKSLANRQRFLRRAKAAIREAVRESSKARGIREVDGGGEVSIPSEGVREPRFRSATGGHRGTAVLPGNKKYVSGDTLPKPPQGGGGAGSEGSTDGEGEDAFRFVLSREEYLDLFFEDLELPNLAKLALASTASRSLQRAGYSTSGSPTNLALGRTMRNSLSRRAAMRRPRPGEIETLRDEIEALAEGDEPSAETEIAELRARLDALLSRRQRVPYIDPIDVRYRRLQVVPKPVSQAVMFCLMDTSASMNEHMKDLAKRFFVLLYLFLDRRYKNVQIVFIRHTHLAEEVDEETFFQSRETGGTVVSTALEKMAAIAAARYPLDQWNIYAAQASDGDNSPGDAEATAQLLEGKVLPLCQFFAYLEVGGEARLGLPGRSTDLWQTYAASAPKDDRFAMCKVAQRTDIYPVFRKLFEPRPGPATSERATP